MCVRLLFGHSHAHVTVVVTAVAENVGLARLREWFVPLSSNALINWA